jgi:predicted O-methyltransferase YrrM
MNKLTYKGLEEEMRSLLPEFERLSAGIKYEDKGILYSEVLFMVAATKLSNINRILESGRARAQSTVLLAGSLPEVSIVSVEYDQSSPDVAIAEGRLKDFRNVELRYGDACVELPRLIQDDDAVLIDGPKMFKAIFLALELLGSRKASMVFIHDVHIGTPERWFLEKFMSEALYSDKKQLAEVGAHMDGAAQKYLPDDRRLSTMEGEFGYGFTLACLPQSNRSYRSLLWIARAFDLWSRALTKVTRVLSVRAGSR